MTATLNRDVFAQDPTSAAIPNDGVAKINEPSTPQEWQVLRWELGTFVCEGEYERGLDAILRTFLSHLDKESQPAAWVSGFYGSGKSHLVRVLEHLWRDLRFPDGATARGIAHLPQTVQDHLVELSTRGRQAGGLWSAAGTLSGGAGDSARLAVLEIVFRSAGLPANYAQGRFVLWLRQAGLEERLRAELKGDGRTLEGELPHLYVSPYLAKALLAVQPDFAADVVGAKDTLKRQFPMVQDLNAHDFLEAFTDVLASRSGSRDRLPLTLLVLDELQQYVGEDAQRMLRVQEVIENCSSRFGSKLLVVATGQSALQATVQLAKLQGRFTVRVGLSETDVERVLRQVVLRKNPTRVGELEGVLSSSSGEIDRQLGGTRIAPTASDRTVWAADYPLLPARRRFWERVLRAVDRAGSAGQLRTQLKIVSEAVRAVATAPLGTVVPADVIYDHLQNELLQSGALLREVDGTIRGERDGTEDGLLRSRLLALAYLVGQLPRDPASDAGVRATPETLADLLVTDLQGGSAPLRARVPALLAGLVEVGKLLEVDGEYRLQTKESAEWLAANTNAVGRILGDDGRTGPERDRLLRQAVAAALNAVSLTQGESKVPRKLDLHFGPEAPPAGTGVPVWVRDEYATGLDPKSVQEEARAAGVESPVVFVTVPEFRPADLKRAIASWLAATEVLQTRAEPTTNDGREAKAAMESRERALKLEVDALVRDALAGARVFLGGGNEQAEGGTLRANVAAAANAALVRLYPRFKDADHAGWAKVVLRAREGHADPLSLLGYQGAAERHPVVAEVLRAVGTAAKGSDVRKGLSAPPFGWSQDSVDGALLTVVAAGHLEARQNGTPVNTKALDQGKLGVTEFRSGGPPPPTAVERLAVKKLAGLAGVNPKTDDVAVASAELVGLLLDAAAAAGGPAPLPERPGTAHVQELKPLVGNELVVRLAAASTRLTGELAAWRAAKALADTRLPRWTTTRRLAEHARELPQAEPLVAQLDAVETNRALLNDPDPVAPVAAALTDLLREALRERRDRFARAYAERLSSLEASGAWRALPEADRAPVLAGNSLAPAPALELGTEPQVLAALDRVSLTDWRDRTDALPARFDRALAEAVKRTQPEAVHVKAPPANLTSEADVTNYLNRLRAEIMEHIEAGHPVVL